jgi:hypothetical protein
VLLHALFGQELLLLRDQLLLSLLLQRLRELS